MKVPKNFRFDEKLNDRLKEYSSKSSINETTIVEMALDRFLHIKEIEERWKWPIDSKEPISGVYKITNKVNGRVYIGKSVDIRRRVTGHFTHEPAHTKRFKEDLKKYSIDDFDIEILEVCDIEDAKAKEIYYIKQFKSYDEELGYNSLNRKFIK